MTPALARLLEDYRYWRPPSLERQRLIDDVKREVETLTTTTPAAQSESPRLLPYTAAPSPQPAQR